MQKVVKTATKRLWEAVDACGENKIGVSHLGCVFPSSFIIGLRGALEAGLSCEQLVAFISIITDLHKALDSFDGEELITRTNHVVEVMRNDIMYLKSQEALCTRRQKIRNKKKKHRITV